MSSRWPHRETARDTRQWPTLERLIEHVEASPTLDGMILLGSFARGQVDALSDLDLVLVVPDGGFEAAWAARAELRGGSTLVAWDQRDPGRTQAGAHKWITGDLVLVECLLATPSSGVRLAEPAAVLAGGRELLDRFPRRPPVTRAELAAHPVDLHPVERAYDQLKEDVRRSLNRGLGGRGPRGR
jgi:Nucleotidyltransferase domain